MIIRELSILNLDKKDTLPIWENKIIWTFTKDKHQYPDHVSPRLMIGNFHNTGDYYIPCVLFNQRLTYEMDHS